MRKDEPVVVELSTAIPNAGGHWEDEITIDRAAWDAMTPQQRAKRLNRELADFVERSTETAWNILSGADESEVDDS